MGSNSIKEKIEIIDIDIQEKQKEFYGSDSSSTTTTENSLNIDGYVPDLEWTEEEEQAIVRKIDLRLFTFVLLMTFVLNMDRTNISNALSDNLAANLGFGITQINNTTTIYAIIFTIGTLVSNAIAKKVGVHLFIPVIMNCWAIATWAHALLQNYAGFLVVRIFIAITECGFIPACLTYVNGWYKTKELATRLAWFWAIQAFASAFSGLISFGIFRMAGIGGLYGWKWLFIIDGILTHIVGIVAFFYVPAGPSKTAGLLRGKSGWFTEREKQIAVTRIIRDDKSKGGQDETVTWHDVKISVLDTKLWTHLILTVVYMMNMTPIGTYFPSLIKSYGFSVTTSNLLTVPSYFINLFFSILIARSADKYGNYALHCTIGCLWAMAGFLAVILIPDNAGPWSFYVGALFMVSYPSLHGMQIAWMSNNLAPSGKRTLALGAVIGAANIAGVPGSQIYQSSDAPRFKRGNWVLFGLEIAAIVIFIAQRTRYDLTNKYRERKWNAMTDEQKKEYLATTKDEGSNRLDFRFIL